MKKSTLFLIILAFIVVGLVLGYFMWPKNLQPNGQPPGIDTSDWKTYRSDEYGFEVKYPGEWNIIQEDNFIRLANPDDFQASEIGDFYHNSVTILIKETDKSLEELADLYLKQAVDGIFFDTQTEKITIDNNIDGVLIGPYSTAQGLFSGYNLVFKRSSKKYVISAGTTGVEKITEDLFEKIFPAMINTIKIK